MEPAVEIQVRMEPGDGPVRGRVRCPPGMERQFAGWIELMRLLEAARRDGAPAARPD
jgi:hypothetical protein